MSQPFDCVVCGISCVDLLIGPVDLHQPLCEDVNWNLETTAAVVGGNVPNCATAMARLGSQIAVLSVIGDDHWGQLLKQSMTDDNIDTTHLVCHADIETSVTAVLMNDRQEHVFAYKPGASQHITRNLFDSNRALFAQSQYALLGYYALLPQIEPVLHEILQSIQAAGCQTALDCAGGGGKLHPLDRCLPYLDIYIPTLHEGHVQTNFDHPQDMIAIYRDHGATGIVGVKLGEDGVLISPEPGTEISLPAITAPGTIVNTTGAGDSFYGGFITGLARGMDVETAARLGTATAAWSVTGLGATAALRSFDQTIALLDK